MDILNLIKSLQNSGIDLQKVVSSLGGLFSNTKNTETQPSPTPSTYYNLPSYNFPPPQKNSYQTTSTPPEYSNYSPPNQPEPLNLNKLLELATTLLPLLSKNKKEEPQTAKPADSSYQNSTILSLKKIE